MSPEILHHLLELFAPHIAKKSCRSRNVIAKAEAWLMKSYPGKILQECQEVYNYCLLRARRVIENTNGILSAKRRIFRRSIKANINFLEKLVKATVCLLNYLQLTENAIYIPPRDCIF